ncbi:MAG TPA: MerR family transcriptional regulator [Thermomicrobiales bacterium]|nr:MerR family transcriptional regulator [Thermomicrobiales bacterium]
MRTHDLARIAGLSTQQIRNYETDGFMPPVPRDPNGYRAYNERHVAALRAIRALLAAGYGGSRTAAIMQSVNGGEIDTGLAIVNARHAELDRDLRQVDFTLEAMGNLPNEARSRSDTRPSSPLRIGEAAGAVGVETSALRFWEAQGVIAPSRDPVNGYRLYDSRQMVRLRLVVLLRRANYGFDAIRSVLDELSAGRPETTLGAIEQRRRDIAATSRLCAAALAALWACITGAGSPP